MRNTVSKKNIGVAVACVLAVAVCIGLAVYFTQGRGYQTVDGSQMEGSDSLINAVQEDGGAAQSVREEGGISVTLQANVPEALDPFRYIKQGYELKNFMAITSFSSAEELPVSAVVQYAFCYLYAGNGCLVDYAPAAMTYRQATAGEIRAQVARLFGSCPQNVEESDLYVPGAGYFEMWQPDYSAEVYAAATFRDAGGGAYTLEVRYYEDAGKTQVAGTSVITVRQADGVYYLASMT